MNGMRRARHIKYENTNSAKSHHTIGLIATTLWSNDRAYGSFVPVWLLEKQ